MKEGSVIQVAYVVRDLDAAMKRHWEVCGMGPWHVYEFSAPKVRDYMYRGKPATHSCLIAVTKGEWPQVELMQPVSGRSIYDEHLEARARGSTTSRFIMPIAPRPSRNTPSAATA